MGEVGTNSSDNPSVDIKMNGGPNGNCEDEAMDVDFHDDSQGSSEISAKKSDTGSIKSENSNVAKSTADITITKIPEDDANASIIKAETKGDNENGRDKQDTEIGKSIASTTTTTTTATTTTLKDEKSSIAVAEIKTNVDQVVADKPTEISNKQIDNKKTVPSDNVDAANNGDATVKLNNGINMVVDDDDDVVEHLPEVQEVQEVHSISDSDSEGEEPKESGDVNPLAGVNESMEVDGKTTNGALIIDNDKPVSIHSDDSDTDDESTNTTANTSNNVNNGSNEVHEILSDKEDCVVIEDDRKPESSEQLTQRRAGRARKSAVQIRNFSSYDDDIEEIIEEDSDPLHQPSVKKARLNLPNLGPQLTIQNARSLAADPLLTGGDSLQQQFLQANKTKEPTLVIIDTNSILARGNTSTTVQALQKQNVSVMPVGGTPNLSNTTSFPINSRASITPIMSNQIGSIDLTFGSSLINANLLPALSDDMFVLEAPSFIVPYIYEKPPSDNLKDIVSKMGVDLEEVRKKEAEKKIKEEVERKEAKDKEDSGLTTGDSVANKKDDKKKKKINKSGDESWDESDESTDDDASDSEERTKVLIKEAKNDLDSINPLLINPTDTLTDSEKKDSNNYFDSPLGKFFMDIGVNLVQEHVQTDLLRQQKKKLSREGAQASSSVQLAINSLMKNLEFSKGHNDVFKFENKRCEFCNFKSESSLVMAHHYETPHMKGNQYKCNFCEYEIRAPYDILFHMKSVHNIQARLEKALSYHQCPNCMFEDNGRSKLARHSVVCQKKFKPEVNLAPPVDWEPPAKIPRIKPRHGLVGTANAYQAMAAQAQRAATAAALQKQAPVNIVNTNVNANANANANRNRGRTQIMTKPMPSGPIIKPNQINPHMAANMLLPANFQLTNAGQFIQVAGAALAMLPNAQKPFILHQNPITQHKPTSKTPQTPSISITALPRQMNNNNMIPNNSRMNAAAAASAAALSKPPALVNIKPGQSPQGKTFVICEICDGYIKDLDQLRNHMQWMHKVKIHPKMIYNRPPLNCQKCQFRFFTDQGLERHLLGSHGLVTSSMQEAANKGKDAGRCPVCGRMYQWKLLNHVSRDHSMTLKPAHLSYKCTVCTATFGMYKQFENHVYSAHSTVAKKATENKKNQPTTSTKTSNIVAGDSLLKPLKINDEITIIPQPSRNMRTTEIESHVID